MNKAVELPDYGRVNYPDIFIEGHLMVCREAYDTRMGHEYFNRLLAYCRMLTDGAVQLPEAKPNVIKVVEEVIETPIAENKEEINRTPTLF